MDQLKELGWAKRWSSQPYVSCRTTSLQELTRLGIKHVENLVIPSVRNDVRPAKLKNVFVALFSYLEIAMVQQSVMI
jgi:hypothetical protein